MASSHYLPPLWSRLRELLVAVWKALVRLPEFPLSSMNADTDCLLVLDALEGYRSLLSPCKIRTIRSVVRAARGRGIPVLFTRWARVDASRGDAVDAKGHWSEYLPDLSQTRRLAELEEDDDGTTTPVVVDVVFPNAFAHAAVCEALPPYVRRVLLLGCWTEACILSTAKGALEKNLRPVVVSNGCAGHEPHASLSLTTVQLMAGEVVRW